MSFIFKSKRSLIVTQQFSLYKMKKKNLMYIWDREEKRERESTER
jgi:hypothetical protein